MAKKAKIKISKVKHSNQVITKLKKQGKLKTQRHKKRNISQRLPVKAQNVSGKSQKDYSDNESLQGSDMMDMMEEDELEYLIKTSGKNGKKQKILSCDELEESYELNVKPLSTNNKRKQLLPIKTKQGFVMQEDDDVVENAEPEEYHEMEVEELTDGVSNEEQIILPDEAPLISTDKPMSAADMLVARHEELQWKKMKIGLYCSAIIESPQIKIDNFYGLLNFMDEKTKAGTENLLTVRKLATISIVEVFKDILPDYQILQHEFGGTKLKKETLLLQKFENTLLAHFKRYLQRLEKMSSVLVRKKGDSSKPNLSKMKLAHIAITCLCDLLVSHSYFNFSSNIAQMLVPFLNNRDPTVRSTVSECFRTIFRLDRKGIISLTVVRKINNVVKNSCNDVNCEVLKCLLALRIKDINLDDEKLVELKQKKQMSHKQRLISMSKKERKRKKKLKELEKEMLETKAEENKQTKQQNLTEIVKIVFTIYFRILKKTPNSRLLSATLEGLAKFAHVMNLEFFSDLVNLLDKLLIDVDLGYREQLYCVDTVFTILSGQGELLNIDPSRFYSHFYNNLLKTHAGRNHEELTITLRTVGNILIKRRKKVSQQILHAILKRISTLSLQLLHNGTLALLGVIKTVMQQSRQSLALLELDQELGSGQYDPFLMEPEHCNAISTAMYELPLLKKHYHPTVRQVATHIMNGVPVTGEGSLPAEIGKMSPEQLFSIYNGSQMAFKPSIPVPKKVQAKTKVGQHTFTHTSFEEYCMATANKRIEGTLDFKKQFDCNSVHN